MSRKLISIDDIFQSTPIGSIDKAVGNNLYGINHEQTPGFVPKNRDSQGFTFVVRPQLNLTSENIENVRKFYPLLSDSDSKGGDGSLSIHRYIRTLLDPRLISGFSFNNIELPKFTCPLVDNKLAFFAVLSNNVTKVSGFPDITIPFFTSPQGRLQESYIMVDGVAENRENYQVDMSFRNTAQDPIVYLFYVWTLYSSLVFSGKMLPYPDFLAGNEIDYSSRIFRIRLDRNKKFVTKMFSTGPAMPMAASIGRFADMNIDEILNTEASIDIRFNVIGFEYFDEILVYEFNKIVGIFNSAMRDENRDSNMVIIPPSIRKLFQNRAYPRINPFNHAMEWWADRSYFQQRTATFLTELNEQEYSPLAVDKKGVFIDLDEVGL